MTPENLIEYIPGSTPVHFSLTSMRLLRDSLMIVYTFPADRTLTGEVHIPKDALKGKSPADANRLVQQAIEHDVTEALKLWTGRSLTDSRGRTLVPVDSSDLDAGAVPIYGEMG